ncbi:MAG: hypothetical protein VKK97_12940, partial [Synechococcaceae cyanobacterium]|nr:hypothetical protein [Synechococcaceae cyanobacterium]
MDQHPLARPQAGNIKECQLCGAIGDRDGGGLDVADPGRQAGDAISMDAHMGSQRPPGEGHDRIAEAQVVDPLADRDHRACAF